MLQLYPARTRLVSILQSGTFGVAGILSAEKVFPYFIETRETFSEQTTVSESYELFAKDFAAQSAPVCDRGNIVGVLRRSLVERIMHENRYEAFSLPISSLVTRSCSVISAEDTSWAQMLVQIKEEKSLAVVACDKEGGICLAVTVDLILDRLLQLIHQSQNDEGDVGSSTREDSRTVYGEPRGKISANDYY